jgi:5,6,7,8-tetrahydromethanopterin hydro-lyase
VEIGEGFVGSGAEAAHVSTMLGERSGPVGAAFATILGSPSVGHVPFLVVARPNLAVRPPTLFVNKAPWRDPSTST